MITQIYHQGENKIKIQIAESLEDAEKNKFNNGSYYKIFINGKITDNYQAMIRFIIDETQKNKSKFIPKEKDIKKLRNDMLLNQKKEMVKQLNDLRKKYNEMGIPKEQLKHVDDYIKQLDETGIRRA